MTDQKFQLNNTAPIMRELMVHLPKVLANMCLDAFRQPVEDLNEAAYHYGYCLEQLDNLFEDEDEYFSCFSFTESELKNNPESRRIYDREEETGYSCAYLNNEELQYVKDRAAIFLDYKKILAIWDKPARRRSCHCDRAFQMALRLP